VLLFEFCARQVPEVKRLDFYSSTDIPLLKFVEAMDRGLPYSRSHMPKAKSLVRPTTAPNTALTNLSLGLACLSFRCSNIACTPSNKQRANSGCEQCANLQTSLFLIILDIAILPFNIRFMAKVQWRRGSQTFEDCSPSTGWTHADKMRDKLFQSFTFSLIIVR
jgi:hypothetical protein